ncbi:MAG TPA: hypothetical protein VHA52_06455 [Candidatus Babeliaceae bacterium]|nr:hypothetical protein [Candidatus Babeliaceae bacterium]
MKKHMILKLLFFSICSLFFGITNVYSITPDEQAKLNKDLWTLIESKIFYALQPAPQDVAQVESLLKQGADINSTSEGSSLTLLGLVIAHLYREKDLGRIQNVQFLIDHGADVNKDSRLYSLLVHSEDNFGVSKGYVGEVKNKAKFLDDILKVSEILLTNGYNPNTIETHIQRTKNIMGVHKEEGYTLLDAAMWYADKIPDLIRLIVLYGGKTYQEGHQFRKLVPEIFPEPVIQAIVQADAKKLQRLLETTPIKVTDNNGISALVYAAGQGNPAIVSLLLGHQAYSHDTTSIEQALEIVGTILRRLKPSSYKDKAISAVTWALGGQPWPSYEQYQEIVKLLESHLEKATREQLNTFLRTAYVQNPQLTHTLQNPNQPLNLQNLNLADMPEEIQQEVFKKLLGNQEIFKRLFGPTS